MRGRLEPNAPHAGRSTHNAVCHREGDMDEAEMDVIEHGDAVDLETEAVSLRRRGAAMRRQLVQAPVRLLSGVIGTLPVQTRAHLHASAQEGMLAVQSLFDALGAAGGGLLDRIFTGFGTKVAAGSIAEIKATLAAQRYIRNPEGRFYLLPATEDSVIAVYWRCVHLGCTVPPPNPALDENIQCPCHGSLYDGRTGALIHGPATHPLDYFPVTLENGNVIVDTGTVIVRQEYHPDQITPLP
jgi:cytochrome b6-f complex iron-sulfur subunit